MAEFLVSGYYGDNNAGDEAILAGMIRAVRDLDPNASFTVISKKAAHTRTVHGVATVSRNDFKNTWRAAARADLVISGGGSLIQDVTSTKSLLYYLGIITVGKLQRKPVMIYAQGIGPVTRPAGRMLVPAIVNGVDLVTVRDPESAQTLGKLGVSRPPVSVTADAALALGPADPELGASLLAASGIETARPLIGVSVRPWKQEGHPWEPALARALDALVRETGARVIFLPMQQPHDMKAARVVAGLMSKPGALLQGDFSHADLQAMVARCDLLIGMRYHALVFAAMNGVPLVGLSYDPKNDSFLRAIGETAAGTTHLLDAKVVTEASRRALAESVVFRRRLGQKMAELTPLSRRNAELALELLKQRGIYR